MFGRKSPQIQMTLDEYLAATVVRNPQAKARDLDAGNVELSLPYRKLWLLRIFTPNRSTSLHRFELDETGSHLWRQIDDRRTVGDLAEYLRTSRDLDDKQAIDSMLAYVQMLLVRGLVGLVVPKQQD